MLVAFLILAQQVFGFAALDESHQLWMRCVVGEAERLAASATEDGQIRARAYAACEREKTALRGAVAREHPEASPADIDDVLSQYQRRGDTFIQAAIQGVRRR